VTLRELIEHGVGSVDDRGATAPALREYRALLSVASAAKRDGSPGCGRDTCRALARLARASTPRRRG